MKKTKSNKANEWVLVEVEIFDTDALHRDEETDLNI